MSVDLATPRRRLAHGSFSISKLESEKADYLETPLHTRVLEDHLPHGAKLALLILALGLSVFLVALVSVVAMAREHRH
jgi:hypothetical protein